MKGVDYSKNKTPRDYKCSKCGATGVKLWRTKYQTTLLCADCAAKEEGEDISTLDSNGKHLNDMGSNTRQIGLFLPAIPTEDGIGFWTSAPKSGWNWWRKLPNRKQVQKKIKRSPLTKIRRPKGGN